MFDRILVPTDGSEGVERAVEYAIDLADRYDAELYVLHVVDIRFEHYGDILDALWSRMSDEGQDVVDHVATKARNSDVPVTTAVEKGIPARTILDEAYDNDVDLIVMGTHGRTGLEHLRLGSVTAYVIRNAAVPVLTASTEDRP